VSPRLIVEVRGGRSGGTKAVLEAGRALRFGRTDLADVVVPYDDQLSGVHFEVSWDGARGRVRDRNSLKGTLLGGLPITRAEVPHGGWIRAGKTDFMVYVEGYGLRRAGDGAVDDAADGRDGDGMASRSNGADTRGGDAIAGHTDGRTGAITNNADEDDETRRLAAARRVLAELRRDAAREPLYAVLDAARDDRIVDILRESVEAHQSLYEGVDGEALDHVAPYLTGPFQAGSQLLDRLVLEGWGRRWGIYVTSRAPFREVRRHFRRFLMVELEDSGEKLYFRFYDPRVMTQLAGTWSDRQRALFFDDLLRIAAEAGHERATFDAPAQEG